LKNIIFFQEFLPHFIGELKNLKTLLVADNKLVYFPYCPSFSNLTEINIKNNYFHLTVPYDHLTPYKESINVPRDFKLLWHIAFFSLIDNFPQLMRQDMPRMLWEHSNFFSRCVKCGQWLLPDYSIVSRLKFKPMMKSFIMDKYHRVNGIPWQVMSCAKEKYCNARRLL